MQMSTRRRGATYSNASELLNRYAFEYWAFGEDGRRRFFVSYVRARSFTEAKHLLHMTLRKEAQEFECMEKTFDFGRDRSWLTQGHKQYVSKVTETKQYDFKSYRESGNMPK